MVKTFLDTEFGETFSEENAAGLKEMFDDIIFLFPLACLFSKNIITSAVIL
jgi:hypothetical protein